MRYYKVWPASSKYNSKDGLTYSFGNELLPGQIVEVSLRGYRSTALVSREVAKPKFKTKEITRVILEPLPSELIRLFEWLRNYYPSNVSAIVQLFIPSSLIGKFDGNINNGPEATVKSKFRPPPLTDEQNNAIKIIEQSESSSFLLFGDTGTGKTRIYMEEAKKAVTKGLSSIILTPEIGLTSQLVQDLEKVFPGQVVVLHSNMSVKSKRLNWVRIYNSNGPLIVVGPRSALFAPIKKLGLIVMDEAHEGAYKQEQSPYYLSSRVAAKLAELHSAKFIMGTATPLVSDYYFMESKKLPIIRLLKPATGRKKESITEVVDITDRNNFRKSQWLSDKMIDSINKSLSYGEQSLVFLNRRGTALVVLCQNCGWQALCPNCDTSLTYHSDTHLMRCHSCGYNSAIPDNCPICHSTNILYKGAGTKAIFEELKKIFPTANIARFDRDNKKGESIAENYQKILKGSIDILVGTQIIIKGFDLPKLSTVGVVLADSNIYLPDYTAEETAFQTITQVMGRVSRGHTDGRVIIQTYHPDKPTLKQILNKDYETFYRNQLVERKDFLFPPFVFMARISTKRKHSESAKAAIENIMSDIYSMKLPVVVNGPSPSFHQKQNGLYVWQIVLKSKNRDNLTKIINNLTGNYSYDLDPLTLL